MLDERKKKIVFIFVFLVLIIISGITLYFVLKEKSFVKPLEANLEVNVSIKNKKINIREHILWRLYSYVPNYAFSRYLDYPLIEGGRFSEIVGRSHIRLNNISSDSINYYRTYDKQLVSSDFSNETIDRLKSVLNTSVSSYGVLNTNTNNHLFVNLDYVVDVKSSFEGKLVELHLGEIDSLRPVNVFLNLDANVFKDFAVNLISPNIEKNGNFIRISGVLLPGETLGLVGLINPGAIFTGFFYDVQQRNAVLKEFDDLKELYTKTSLSRSFEYNFTKTFNSVLKFLVVLIAILIPTFFYLFYSSTKIKEDITVEETSSLPDPDARPWEINMLIKNNTKFVDHYGFVATLLWLHYNKYIELRDDGIYFKSPYEESYVSEESYADEVMRFLKSISDENNFIDYKNLVKGLKNNSHLINFFDRSVFHKVLDFKPLVRILIVFVFPLICLAILLYGMIFLLSGRFFDSSIAKFYANLLLFNVLISSGVILFGANKIFIGFSREYFVDKIKWQKFASYANSDSFQMPVENTNNSIKKTFMYLISLGEYQPFVRNVLEKGYKIEEFDFLDKLEIIIKIAKILKSKH